MKWNLPKTRFKQLLWTLQPMMLIIATTIVCRMKTHYGTFVFFTHYLYSSVIPKVLVCAQYDPLVPADEMYNHQFIKLQRLWGRITDSLPVSILISCPLKTALTRLWLMSFCSASSHFSSVLPLLKTWCLIENTPEYHLKRVNKKMLL